MSYHICVYNLTNCLQSFLFYFIYFQTLINVHDWPPTNGSPNRAVLYFYDNTQTVYDQNAASFETRL